MRILIASLFVIFSLFVSAANAVCTSYCKPGVSRACGNGCVSLFKQCRKSWTTACNGERPATASKSYSNPKHIEPKPVDGSNSADAPADNAEQTDAQ